MILGKRNADGTSKEVEELVQHILEELEKIDRDINHIHWSYPISHPTKENQINTLKSKYDDEIVKKVYDILSNKEEKKATEEMLKQQKYNIEGITVGTPNDKPSIGGKSRRRRRKTNKKKTRKVKKKTNKKKRKGNKKRKTRSRTRRKH